MKDNKPCVVWEKAKTLAADRGFQMRGECPVNSICEGECCIYIAESAETESHQLKKFEERQKKTDTIRLQEVRGRLNKILAEKRFVL